MEAAMAEEDSSTTYEIALTHFLVSADVERSARFYSEVLGGPVIRSGQTAYVVLANGAVIINVAS